MELDGHPTNDIIEELARRGGIAYPGNSIAPDPAALELVRRRGAFERGVWIFLPGEAFETGFDEPPA
jgi:hypothetical protein